METSQYIPLINPNHITVPNELLLEKIVASNVKLNVFISGLSGCGKTTMVEQICARNSRELVRVNITHDTDEFDLIGSYKLINGETVWNDGPVVVAMKKGAILLLDECDLGSPRIMAIQAVLEGKEIFIKKINTHVYPAEGFRVVATANTKGKGSMDGRFVGTQVLNEAFLDRFAILIEQEYPSTSDELKILQTYIKNTEGDLDDDMFDFTVTLQLWAENIRQAYKDNRVDEVVSTRRLVDILKTYQVLKEQDRSIALGISRFDDVIKESFMHFWTTAFTQISKQRKQILDSLKEKQKNMLSCFLYEDVLSSNIPANTEIFVNQKFVVDYI